MTASIPSPSQSVWHLGPIPIRAYALCIVLGITVAVMVTRHRWIKAGGKDEEVWDIAGWAIVFGIVGGRIYHVITDPELYFKAVAPDPHAHPFNAVKIWDGGLGIWGAIALGGMRRGLIRCRRKHVSLARFADAAAPGIVLAQGIGRWGNWFNNELYGGPTSLPWRLQIHSIDVVTGHSERGSGRPMQAGPSATSSRRSCTSRSGTSGSGCCSSTSRVAGRWGGGTSSPST